MKRWTKKEFIEIVQPCGYRFRIWWWFLWHRYVTLLDIVNYTEISSWNRTMVIANLDYQFYSLALSNTLERGGTRGFAWGDVVFYMRKELENDTD